METEVPPRKKRKILQKRRKNEFRINLSDKPLDICNILTNLEDPNSSDLDFITDDESVDYDKEEEQSSEEEVEGVQVCNGVTFERQVIKEVDDFSQHPYDSYIESCIENLNEDNIIEVTELIPNIDKENVAAIANTNDHTYSNTEEHVILDRPGPSGCPQVLSFDNSTLISQPSTSFSKDNFETQQLMTILPYETSESSQNPPYKVSDNTPFAEDFPQISNSTPLIIVPDNSSTGAQPISDINPIAQTSQHSNQCVSRKKIGLSKNITIPVLQKTKKCKNISKTTLQNKNIEMNKKTPKKDNKKKTVTNKIKNKMPNPAKWFAKDNNHVRNVPTFLGSVVYSLSNENKGTTPSYFFSNIFPKEIYESIAFESNLYAAQKGHTLGASPQEIKIFLAINIIMTFIKYPSYRMYWSTVSSLRMDLIANAMPLKKFEKIKRFLHFTDNTKIPEDNRDIFIKIKPLVDKLNETFQQCVTPVECVAVDEMIISFKGRNRAKQYIKSKPKKWGFKAWVLAGSNGYVYKFELYQGRLNITPSKMGVIADTVLRLTSDLQGQNHKLFLDNLFVSIPLVEVLLKKQIYVVGTLRSNRLPRPADEVLGPSKDLSAKERGSMAVATSENNTTITRWVDSGVVSRFARFTYAGIEPIDTVQRWDVKQKRFVEVERPFCVAEYNKFMGGVDLADRMVAHYPHTLKNKKFYLRIFFHFVNVALSNAWIMFKEKTGTKIPFLEFKASVAESLVIEGMKKTKKGRPSLSPKIPLKVKPRPGVVSDIRFDNDGHFPEKFATPNRCREKNCNRRSRYRCQKCAVHLCPECMQAFHTQD